MAEHLTVEELNSAEEQLLVEAERLLNDWDGIGRILHEGITLLRGRVCLGCHPSVANFSLPKFLPTLLLSFPELEINLFHYLSRNITEAVISSTIDLGIVIHPIAHPDLIIKDLGLDEVTLWTKIGGALNEDILIYDPNVSQSQKLLSQKKDRDWFCSKRIKLVFRIGFA